MTRPRPQIRAMLARVAILATAFASACSDPGGPATGQPATDSATGSDGGTTGDADTVPDTAPDTVTVTDTDTVTVPDTDTAPDTVSDTAADTGPAPDAAPDTAADTAPDTASPPDTSPDTGPDLAALLPKGLGASPCQVDGELPALKGIDFVPWFTGITFWGPIDLNHPGDGTDRVAVVERGGVIKIFKNSKTGGAMAVMLNIKSKVSTSGEGGLLGMAFHPKFASNGHFFVNYTAPGPFRTVIARYTVPPGKDVANPASAKVLLEIKQPFSNHDGGQIAFDGKGMLLIGMGDGGSGGDPFNHGQDTTTLLGAMLRIDVDGTALGKPYGIPADNPMTPGWKPEIYAVGLRNPWRFSLDPPTGLVWIADVGQNAWEEVDLLEAGANYGWNQVEGNHCYKPGCSLSQYTAPVFEYSHNLGKSITGGRVYRGSASKSLWGAYVFGDYGSGRFWATRKKGGKWVTEQVAYKPNIKPVTFGADLAGELYVTQLWGQAIHKVVELTKPPAGKMLPAKLSQTGCFSDLAKLTPANGVLSFSVNAPLWSDGAHKWRYLVPPPAAPGAAKPAQTPLPADDRASWDLPTGTLLIKHFGLGADPTKTTPVETRFMRRDASGWRFMTYAWNAAGTDADLVVAGKEQTWTLPGGGKQTWPVPSVGDCQSCHGGAKGPSPLGVRSDQLDGPVELAGKTVQQLAVWQAGGLLDTGFKGAGKHQPLTDPTSAAAAQQSLQTRARTYLDVQCAGCHRPGGAGQSDTDLRVGTSLKGTKTCNKPPQHGDMGVSGAKIVTPGAASKSLLHLRMADKAGTKDFMPALGVNVPDAKGIKLVKDWIQALNGCP